MGEDAGSRWDVFFSYARTDAASVAPFLKFLRDSGFRVFVDEAEVAGFTSLNGEIAAALSASRLLLAFYSPTYPTRPSCQWELTTAFLAGQRDGDPRGRVIMVVPDPDAAEVALPELRDARHWTVPADAASERALLGAIRSRLDALRTPIGWLPDASVHGVPRFRELWRVHSALVGPTPRTCLVTGIAGSGKTTLARQYADIFASAFDQPVAWHDRDAALPSDTPSDGLTVVDGVRAGDEPQLRSWLRDRAVTESVLLLGRHRLDLSLDTLALPGLERPAARQLLHGYHRPAERADADAAEALVADAGGHPQAIHLAGLIARDLGGRRAFGDALRLWHATARDELERFAARVGTLPDGYPASVSALREILDGLPAECLDVLRVLSTVPPTLRDQRLLIAIMNQVRPGARHDAAVEELRAANLVAEPHRLAPVVARAIERYDPDPVRGRHVRRATLLVLAGYGGSAPSIDTPPGDPMSAAPLTRVEQEIGFRLQTDLSTRISTVPLGEDGGVLREALTSLNTLFSHAREAIRDLAGHRHSGQVQALANRVIDELRPLLTYWHPALLDHESTRPATVGTVTHERNWDRAAELRAALNDIRGPLGEVNGDLEGLTGASLTMG
ncbi:MAG TPA: toll/interleukin-1 receptor domain-containing protein [Stackebrandtia sp.]|uniref:toll/interleukin-1 receptor domain-containing protein n=1 Tax=Stackebrandtia sp. TaxID=2023065 RepID=UPI002D2F80BE|nr:toll/interleukin-1 receptor domain-containing protein [Stackebrandtia sp.]HZE40922.1 toll/interleukin-1 receptor domain-containing protein [Stackebrandtia sp.]